MGKVYKKNQAEEDEQRRADQSNIIPPEHEEPIGNEEGHSDECNPE